MVSKNNSDVGERHGDVMGEFCGESNSDDNDEDDEGGESERNSALEWSGQVNTAAAFLGSVAAGDIVQDMIKTFGMQPFEMSVL